MRYSQACVTLGPEWKVLKEVNQATLMATLWEIQVGGQRRPMIAANFNIIRYLDEDSWDNIHHVKECMIRPYDGTITLFNYKEQ